MRPRQGSMATTWKTMAILLGTSGAAFFSARDPRRSSVLFSTEDLFAAVHRKEHEMRQFSKEHQAPSDPIRMAMGYLEASTPALRLAKALRRVHEDPVGDAEEESETMSMRRGSFVADVKRSSPSGEGFRVGFDDAGRVAESMVSLGADCVFVSVDYTGYGGDASELASAVRAVRKTSQTAAVVMKDVVVDEIQIGIAKDAGADGILLIAAVLGPALGNFLDLCSIVGLEAIVECHTKNEVEVALNCLAQNIMVTNYDRISKKYYPDQAEKLAGLFPGSGGPIISLACGGISTQEQVRKILGAGYDGVVVGKAIMGNARAPEFINAVRDRSLLPAEFSGWGLEDYDFDADGSVRVDDEGLPEKKKEYDDLEGTYE